MICSATSWQSNMTDERADSSLPLDDELSTAIHTYLTTAPTSEFVQQAVRIHDHWQGSDNLLWRVECAGQEAVLKLYLDAGQARSRRQFDGHQLFAQMGITPRPLWYDRYPLGLARQVLVYDWAPGTQLDAADAAGLRALAETVARVHATDPDEVRRFSPNPINLDYFWSVQSGSFAPIRDWLETAGATALRTHFDSLAAAGSALVKSALPLWQQAAPTPVHGDLKVENCVVHFGTVALLDWELFGLGDPALEVAKFLYLHSQALTADQQSDWLEHYLSARDAAGLAERVAVYQRLLPFHSVCYLLDGLRTLPADLPEREATLRFLRQTLTASVQQATMHLDVAAALADPAALSQQLSELFAQLPIQTTEE